MSVGTERDLRTLVRVWLARRLGEDEALAWLGDADPLAPAGVDSVLLIGVVGELEEKLGVVLADDAVLEEASINSLALALSRGERT
ncbi:acyl carrier protein [Parafrankia discariae]|uniref:acyl carrier protein n=1 Tax=Parafrankia discariae TaxID=365528 RepID=UPI00036E2CC9|nr:acyl carrier protein [Parafrankia discariae]